MLRKSNFAIEKCMDCYRVTRTDVDDDLHTHIKSLRLCNLVIKAVIQEKIPLCLGKRCLISAQRLSDNKEYIEKIDRVLHAKKAKGKKQKYVNRRLKGRKNV